MLGQPSFDLLDASMMVLLVQVRTLGRPDDMHPDVDHRGQQTLCCCRLAFRADLFSGGCASDGRDEVDASEGGQPGTEGARAAVCAACQAHTVVVPRTTCF